MKKLISFKMLKAVCVFEYPKQSNKSDCGHVDSQMDKKCCARYCPVWKKLKEAGK